MKAEGQPRTPAEQAAREEPGLPLLPGFREMALRRMATERRRLVSELTAQRQSAGLSQTQVAARMGTSQSAVARIEAGDADVRASTLERYAAAIGNQLSWRLADEPAAQPPSAPPAPSGPLAVPTGSPGMPARYPGALPGLPGFPSRLAPAASAGPSAAPPRLDPAASAAPPGAPSRLDPAAPAGPAGSSGLDPAGSGRPPNQPSQPPQTPGPGFRIRPRRDQRS
jgi:DNA-binding XRE family transcriptional regulator